MTQCFKIFIFFKQKHPITWHVVLIFLNHPTKVKEPLNRCTASEALVHPWFQIGESPRSCQRHLNTLPEQMNGVMAASCESLGERVGARGDLISGAKEPQNLPNHRVEWCDFSEICMGKMWGELWMFSNRGLQQKVELWRVEKSILPAHGHHTFHT